jgi:hypothetical protein
MQPAMGRVLVSADIMAGVFPKKADYFLRLEGLRPISQVGYGHLLLVVPAQMRDRWVQRTKEIADETGTQ